MTDVASPGFHPLAEKAKDFAAGAVLMQRAGTQSRSGLLRARAAASGAAGRVDWRKLGGDARFLTAEWRNLVMLNYELDPRVLAARVPRGCELDPGTAGPS